MVTIINDKSFRNTFKIRIVVSYFIIIIFCLVLINFFSYYAFENTYLVSSKNELMSYARNVSSVASRFGRGDYLNSVVASASRESKSRIIIVDKNSLVISDSSGIISGSRLADIGEVIDALRGEESWGKHITIDDEFLYVSYPVTKGNISIGAVLMLHSVGNIYKNINQISKELIIISVFILLLGGMFSYLKASSMTKPIENVIDAIEAMSQGEFKKKVYVKGNDEIARLCHAFNEMNEKINRIDEERRQFVANASHELKSPLASIKVLVQSLLAGGIDDKKISMEFLENIDDEIDRLTGIVNNLLELTKLEASNGMAVESFDIGTLCRDVIKKLIPIANTKNVEIRFNSCPEVVIEGNRDNIFRAVYNIVENAVKYSRENNFVDVWIEKDDMVKINIKDSGIGIPEEDIPKIFQRFYRVDKTRDRKTGGSGLGLSIVYEIIKLHKGDIKVESKVGKGSLFVITLPYKA